MSIVKQRGHQDVLCCVAEIAIDGDLVAGTYPLLELPGDAIILRGSLNVSTAVTGMTNPTAAFNLALAGGDEVLLAATSIAAAAETAFTGNYDGAVTGEVVNVEVVIAGTGTPTAGKVYAVVEYTRTDRVTELR
jgi:hypothetical protein